MGKNIYFFWDNLDKIPEKYASNINMAKAIHPDYNVEVFDVNKASELIKSFDMDLHLIFNSVMPPACKSDIFRLVVLYINGGWYLDCDLRLIRRLEYIEFNNKASVFVRDDSRASSITNMALYFPQRAVVLLKMMELIKSYYSYCLYNHDVWSFSGPGLFNVFYDDPEFEKLSFIEYFKSDKVSTFQSIHTNTSTSWHYQQAFGVYKKELLAVKFRNQNEYKNALNYSISIGEYEFVNDIILANKGNYNINYSEEQIRYIPVVSLIKIYSDIKCKKLLSQILSKVDVGLLEYLDFIYDSEPPEIFLKYQEIKNKNVVNSVFLLYVAYILRPKGPKISIGFLLAEKDEGNNKLFSLWNNS